MTSIDVHLHAAPDLDRLASLPGVLRRRGAIIVDGEPLLPTQLYDVDEVLAHLDNAGIDLGIVSPPPGLYRQNVLEQDELANWVAALNDGMAKRTGERSRLPRLAYLPLEAPAVALAEVERTQSDPGVIGFAGAAASGSLAPSSPDLEPLWERLDAERAMIVLHPGIPRDSRLGAHCFSILLGHAHELALTAAQLLFGGVLTRFPNITFVLTHAGGSLPALLGRWEHAYRMRKPGVLRPAHSPAHSARGLRFDTLANDQGVIDHIVATLGEDALLAGSDWPFSPPHRPRDDVSHRGEDFVARVVDLNAHAVLRKGVRSAAYLSQND